MDESIDNENKINFVCFSKNLKSDNKDLVIDVKKKCEIVLFNNRIK